MGSLTTIEWCDRTFNPWWGCAAVSPGCDNCYAEAWARRTGRARWGPHAERVRMSEAYWRQPLAWNRAPHPGGRRWIVFCASMADVFDNQAPAAWREALFRLVRATPALDWHLLTKRPQNIAGMLPPDWGTGYANVRLGVTAENQAQADIRVPRVLAVPHRLAPFISHEPVLERVSFRAFDGLGWILVGGESGARARPCALAHLRAVVAECRARRVPVFVKQLGRRVACPEVGEFPGGESLRRWRDGANGGGVRLGHPKGGDPEEWPLDLRVREFPR